MEIIKRLPSEIDFDMIPTRLNPSPFKLMKARIPFALIVSILSLAAGVPSEAADYRPDLLIGETRDKLKGDNKYLGGSQKIRLETEGKTKFFVRVENDGDLEDTIKMRGRTIPSSTPSRILLIDKSTCGTNPFDLDIQLS